MKDVEVCDLGSSGHMKNNSNRKRKETKRAETLVVSLCAQHFRHLSELHSLGQFLVATFAVEGDQKVEVYPATKGRVRSHM